MLIIADGARLESPIAIKRAFLRRFEASQRAARELRPQQLMDVIEKQGLFLLRKDPEFLLILWFQKDDGSAASVDR